MPNYNTTLQTNNSSLEEIITQLNNMPDAGSGGTDTSDATAIASEIFKDKTAYGADGKITGTFTIDSEISTQKDLISQISTLLDSKAAPDYEEVDQATPSITVSSSGLITASATQSAGLVAAGTKSATKQLTTQAAKTITPSTSSQTAVAKNVYTTGAVTVGAIPSTYVKPTATKTATTYTPSTSNQTIAAGTYCSGAQTIKGDSNLVAGNIKSGVSIFGVTGTHSGAEDLDSVITELETKVTTLNAALADKASGGGGGVETCTLRLASEAPTASTDLIYYIDGISTTAQTANFPSFGQSSVAITVMKNSIIYSNTICQPSTMNITTLIATTTHKVFFVSGDTDLTIV